MRTIHPELESAPAPVVKIVSRGQAPQESGGEQLPPIDACGCPTVDHVYHQTEARRLYVRRGARGPAEYPSRPNSVSQMLRLLLMLIMVLELVILIKAQSGHTVPYRLANHTK